MSTIIDEGALRFDFDDDWLVVKWDDHGAFVNGVRTLEGTKAVDFIGACTNGCWLIEVKDFRRHRIENKDRLASGDLAREVACKVRDSIAGTIWACDREHDDTAAVWSFVRSLWEDRKVKVVLWLEQDQAPPHGFVSALGERIRRELRWLNPKVIVMNLALTREKPVQGLAVSNLPAPPPA